MLNIIDIASLIRRGEGTQIEFKTRVPAERVIARTLAAFANTTGGTLLIGVDDSGQVEGLTQSEVRLAEARLSAVARGLLPYPVTVNSVNVDGRPLVYIQVPPAPEHLRPVATASGEVVVRRNAKDEAAGVEVATVPPGPRCVLFVAMSFRDEEEPHLVDYFDAMTWAAGTSGLPIAVERIDLESGDYEISQKIMDKIDLADIVLADFTLSSRNVYFELGYARGKGKIIIQTARQGTVLEFDVRNWRTLFYKNSRELRTKLATELVEAYRQVVGSK
jgi:hypothetical protein